MPIKYEVQTKGKYISYKDFHFIFGSIDELTKRKFTIPPIRDIFRVCLIDASYNDILYLKNSDFPEFVEITVFTKEEILITLGIINKQLSPYEQLLKYLENYPIYLESKLVKKLYFNTDNPIEILEDLKDLPSISEKDIVKYFKFDKKIFAIDVVYSIFTYRRKLNSFKKYYSKNPVYYITSLIEVLGEQHAYYAVRKVMSKLFKSKLQYLEKGNVKLNKSMMELIKVIDVYEITFAYTLMYFYNGTNLFILLKVLERREKDVSLFYGQILADKIRDYNIGV